ncbi:choice-of-anchor D domain-containing protein [Dasania sp. GY-MA-18]|uniref:Choice-of-anchor D domain-containing protein n=1 Tax=Dasania phycosphaerae TaxID=2950436 RepID=A0A9J6RSC8_9GAMM|nr:MULTISPECIES: choice-of-anchor D domain-containing protein [Dasania]MCR8924412.1 choice-of-anchor D domain-containing protein [Dasania sp. GY-MA-18]MCZ0867087.1 choice-of-anchor D domain-containing protein [Dasania phycosphaerae]MCZ0870539.1 choice-of-anchor D domain-containing protein [Dasania phycosphaerae]
MKYQTVRASCLAAALGLALSAQADTIFYDDFQDGTSNGWTASGAGYSTVSWYGANASLRVSRTKTAEASVATNGYIAVSVSLDLAAYSLEYGDACYVEVSSNGGSSWTTLLTVADGSDDSAFRSYSGSPAGADDNTNFKLRVRAAGNLANDYCYLDNVLVTGTAGSGGGAPEISVSGSGNLGSVQVGASSTSVITISNEGDAALAVGSLAGLASPFSLSVDNCSNSSVAAGNSCTATVDFSPTAAGSFNDTLIINSDDSDESVVNIAVSGTGLAQGSCDYDCLTGNGNVSRSTVTYANLTGSATNGSLVDFSGFSLPANAANPSNTFEGTLSFTGVQRGWVEISDEFAYGSLAGAKQLPNFNYKFVQHGTHIIPEVRGLIENGSTLGEWDLILEPGRVWDENSDNGYSRAAIPFTLVEYNQNCSHNGVLTFLFNNSGSISNVQYQIASETCAYYQFNMYGRLAASYTPSSVSSAAAIKSAYETEVANRMVTKSIAELAADYPAAGVNISNIASDQAAADLSVFGVVYNGVHYVGGCNTRYGTYPFCDVMTLPSYSTAKSVVGGLSLMRLEQKYTGSKDAIVKNYVPECSNTSKWGSVTLEDALDMATGNYDSAAYEADETNYAVDWLYTNTHSGKVDISCNFYSHKEAAGQTWVYHSSDTYLVGRGVNEYLKGQEGASKEYFADLLVADVYQPLGLSPSMFETIRTRDAESAAVAGLGLFYHRDDVVKLAEMLNNDNGKINGVQVLDAAMVNASLQRNANDRGLPLDPAQSTPTGYYNNSFWAYDLNASSVVQNCNAETWIPYMSGYGGIGIQMLPNGMTYYFFSDGFDYSFTATLNELNKISAICN